MRGSGEKSLSIANLDLFIIRNLSIRPTGHDFEQIAVRTNRRCWDMTQLLACHHGLGHGVVHPVNLDVELMLGFLLLFFVSHKGPFLMQRYQDTTQPRYLTTAVLWCILTA